MSPENHDGERLSDLNRQMQGKLIRDELARRGWNQSDLGRATKLPRYVISRLVRGEAPINRENAHRIALALDLDANALLHLATPSASLEFAEGIQSTAQPDGMVRIRANMLVQPGVHLAIEALAAHDEPIRTDRLVHLLGALIEPLPVQKSGSKG